MRPGNRYLRALCSICALFLCSCGEFQPEPLLRVGCIVWPGYEPLFLARHLGAYKDHPIQLVEYSSPGEAIRALEHGAIEAAAVTGDEMLRMAQDKVALRAILIMDISNGGDALAAHPSINSLRELKGKRVGVEANGVGSYLLSRAVQIAGMNISDLRIVNVAVADQDRAYQRGTVDAVVTFEPTLSRLTQRGAKVLFDSSHISGEILDFLVVREKIISSHESTLRALVRGWFEARETLIKAPRESARVLASREGLAPEQFLRALRGLRIPDAMENLALLGKSNSPARLGLQSVGAFLSSRGLLAESQRLEPPLDARIVSSLR
jgi:NitT/TauT family transport system substrate-binding protein